MADQLPFYYIIHLQYLGFRYHGWQKQPNGKTVQEVTEKTLSFVLGHKDFKILAAGRTDARVSANHTAIELFIGEPQNPETLLEALNNNFPGDVRALSVEETDRHFNIIQNPKIKEYIYLFSHGEKNHPFCAPFMVYMPEQLDVERMKEGAKLFEGFHDFRNYCYKPNAETKTEREVMLSEIRENDLYKASFFPEQSFIYHVHGKGFLRHQVRLMMGALFSLGKGTVSPDDIRRSLTGDPQQSVAHMAPQYGLMLHKIHFM